ncbi:MAG: 6-phosphogluconolactonase [Deltaproteobacteria bacterium]|nr:6-phosphogluconolactonase [Deltaproteobacteria bacterium]
MKLKVLFDRDELALEAANIFIETVNSKREAPVSIALSGGSTPLKMFSLLSSPEFKGSVDWSRVHIFFGDERCVAPDDSESNFFSAQRELLSKVGIPTDNVHRIKGELLPVKAAKDYEEELMRFFPEPRVRTFDLIFLGLGSDCHTLSLFPDTNAIGANGRLATENYVEKLDSWRITLTPEVVNASKRIVFLVHGASKAEALRQALSRDTSTTQCPAKLITPINGDLLWLVTSESATELK